MGTTYKFTKGSFDGAFAGWVKDFVAGGGSSGGTLPGGSSDRYSSTELFINSVGPIDSTTGKEKSDIQFTLDSLDNTPMTIELTEASLVNGTAFDYEMFGVYDSVNAERVDGNGNNWSPSSPTISDIWLFNSLILKITSIAIDSSTTKTYALHGDILQFTFKDIKGDAWYTTPDMWAADTAYPGRSYFTMTAELTEVVEPEPEPDPDPDPDPEPEPEPVVLNNIYYRNKKVTEIYVHGVKISKAFAFGKQVFG